MIGASIPLVGRDAELTRLRGYLEQAGRGTGAAVVVRGEPGVGKSRLLAAVGEQATGFAVLCAAGVQSESDLAFGALATLIAPLHDSIDALPAVQAASLRAAVGLGAGTPGERLTTRAAWP